MKHERLRVRPHILYHPADTTVLPYISFQVESPVLPNYCQRLSLCEGFSVSIQRNKGEKMAKYLTEKDQSN